MASSSDESFAWTNASNSSNSTSDSVQKANHKMMENGLNEDSDYGKSYKKKLHKKLFVNNEVDDQSEAESHHPKEKKRKHKLSDEDIESPKKKTIKMEPESDMDTPKKKKKIKMEQQYPEELQYHISNAEILQDNDPILTKEEQGIDSKPKSKKQRKSTQSNTSISSNHDMEYSTNSIKKDESNTELEETNCAAPKDEELTKKKKKKSKKRQHSQCEDDSVGLEDKLSKDMTSYSQLNGTVVENENSSFKIEKSIKKLESNKEYNSCIVKSEQLSDSASDNKLDKHKDKIKLSKNLISDVSPKPGKKNKRESRLSEKIKNEDADDDNTEIDISIINKADNTMSRKIKKFLKINENLKQISPREHECALSSDDDIWAIKCPQNIDVNSFLGTNIKLNGKCRIKLDNQAHIGSMKCESAHLTVLLSEHDDFVIKKIPLNGTLHLHMKLPKVHVTDNHFIDNHTDFVPVPNTKKRHPLFGSNYKKAIKVPSPVARKFNETYNDSISESVTKKKKKKHKTKEYNNEQQIEENYEPLSTENNTSFNSKKKNRKRKHKTENEHSSTKRVKHDIDSSTVWESEQAIEENLFNS